MIFLWITSLFLNFHSFWTLLVSHDRKRHLIVLSGRDLRKDQVLCLALFHFEGLVQENWQELFILNNWSKY